MGRFIVLYCRWQANHPLCVQGLLVGRRLGVTEGRRVNERLYMSPRSNYICADCQKTFLKKPSALWHTRARCGGGLQTTIALNNCFVNPVRYTMPTAPAITSGATPWEQTAEARRRIREVAEQG